MLQIIWDLEDEIKKVTLMTSQHKHRKTQRSEEERARLKRVREQFQNTRPTPDELLATGDVTEFVPLGEYLDLRQAVQALKQQRERKGLSLAAVAERSKIDKSALSRLENGLQANPTVATLYRYASAVDAQIVWSVRGHR